MVPFSVCVFFRVLVGLLTFGGLDYFGYADCASWGVVFCCGLMWYGFVEFVVYSWWLCGLGDLVVVCGFVVCLFVIVDLGFGVLLFFGFWVFCGLLLGCLG